MKATDDESIPETVAQAISGEDEPMEDAHPKASFGMVALTYPLALIVLLVIAYFVYSIL